MMNAMETAVKNYIESFEEPAEAGLYRIVDRGCKYEPQMSYSMGNENGFAWFPLNEDGYWLEPDAFSTGYLTKCSCMPLSVAKRSIRRAMAINGVHLQIVTNA
jgi:hypothetical protein